MGEARISNGYRNRDCLFTCGTGAIEDEDKVRLVSGYAYAILEIMEFEGTRMLLVKNPWGTCVTKENSVSTIRQIGQQHWRGNKLLGIKILRQWIMESSGLILTRFVVLMKTCILTGTLSF